MRIDEINYFEVESCLENDDCCE